MVKIRRHALFAYDEPTDTFYCVHCARFTIMTRDPAGITVHCGNCRTQLFLSHSAFRRTLESKKISYDSIH